MTKTAKHRDANAARKPSTTTTKPGAGQDLVLQQKCLDLFKSAFAPDASTDSALIQEVKTHLFNRDFARAFSRPDYLQVYASRWSPSRALGYLQVLQDMQEHILGFHAAKRDQHVSAGGKSLSVLCLGGGAGAELAALASWWACLSGGGILRTALVDIADWTSVVEELTTKITTPPEVSKYAPVAKKEANVALLPEGMLAAEFVRQDVLDFPDESLQHRLGDTELVTVLFTLNELYGTSLVKTQKFLAQLTQFMRTGSLLLVVDSPGTYSTVAINGAEKKYPMQWLLNHTMLGSSSNGDGNAPTTLWEKIISDDSRWFRLPQGLQYPIELENMRYQIHVYRKMSC